MARKRKRTRGDTSDGISRRQAIGLLGAGGLALVGLQQTGAFDAVIGDRRFSVGTGDDSEALLGMAFPDPITGQTGETVDIVELTNNAASPFQDIQVFITNAPTATFDDLDVPIGLEVGDSATVTGTLDCNGVTGIAEVTLRIIVDDHERLNIDAPRTVTVECAVPVFDPLKCADIADAAADIEADSPLVMRGEDVKPGHVAMDEPWDTTIDLGGNAVIEGFLRAESGTNLWYDFAAGTPVVEGAVLLIAENDVTYDDRGTSDIWGDLCIRAGTTANVAMRGTTAVGGHIDVEAGQSINMEVANGTVTPGAEGIHLSAGGNVVLEITGTSDVEADVHIEADQDINVTLRGNSIIDGDLYHCAGTNFNLNTIGRAEVTGDVIESC